MLLCSNSNKINNNWPIKQEDDRFRPSSIMSVYYRLLNLLRPEEGVVSRVVVHKG